MKGPGDREERERERRDYHGDVSYEAWRRGENPDLVDRDHTDDCYDRGVWPEEC